MDSLFSITIVFNIIWSIATILADKGNRKNREAVNNFIKTKILKIYINFPIEGEVFDYFIDYRKIKFVKWERILP